jgi:xylulokinase
VPVERALLVGGGARSEAVRALAAELLGIPVVVPAPGEYVADGAARQAAWAWSEAAEPPPWQLAPTLAEHQPARSSTGAAIRARYAAARDLTLTRDA